MNAWSLISVVMIVRDAERALRAALESIPREAEIIVADGGSQDRTASLARSYGARVVPQDLDLVSASGGNFDLARNSAAKRATRPWTLFLDADERLSTGLTVEIDTIIQHSNAYAAFDIPRRNLFWGRPVRLMGEDRQLRLVQAGKGQYEGRALHQPLRVDGIIGHLRSPLIHENVRNCRDVIRRFRQYIPIEAKAHPIIHRWKDVWSVPFRMFRYYYVGQGSWKDGLLGLIVTIVYAAHHGAVAWMAWRDQHA